MDVDGLTRDGVLFQAHLGDVESVDYILRVQGEIDFTAGGQNKLAAHEVVCARGIAWVEPQGIAFAWCDQVEAQGKRG